MDPLRIYRLRTRLGLSQSQFARLLGLKTKGAISHFEAGKHSPVGPLLNLLLLLEADPEKNSRNLSPRG